MREQLGKDRVYDVIDELLEDVPLVKLLERSIDAEDGAAVARETEQRVKDEGALKERAAQLIAVQKKQSLASRLDLRSARELRDASDEKRLQPLFMRNFFMRASKPQAARSRRTVTSRSTTSAGRRPKFSM